MSSEGWDVKVVVVVEGAAATEQVLSCYQFYLVKSSFILLNRAKKTIKGSP